MAKKRIKKSEVNKPTAKSRAVENTISLSNRAMLVDLRISTWEGRKKDTQVTEEVTEENGASTNAGAWWTRLIPPEDLKPIGSAVHHARTAHFKHTLPWSDSGPRVLPSELFFDYSREMRRLHDEFDMAVDGFLAKYPALVDSAPDRLGKLMPEKGLPSADQIRAKFGYKTNITPIPESRDFRVDLGEGVTDEIRQDIQKQADTALATAMGDLWRQLHVSVSKIAERLGDAKGVFRDSLISNLVELCELMPKMNVTGDKRLEEMRVEVVAKLTKQDTDVLRKNKVVRADAAQAANSILKQMEAYMGKKG